MVPLLADQPELSKYGEYKNEDDDKDKDDDKDDDKDKDNTKSSILLKVMFFIKMKYMDYRQGLTKTLKKRNNSDQTRLGADPPSIGITFTIIIILLPHHNDHHDRYSFVFRAALHHVRLCRTHASAICDQKVKI